MQGGGLIRRVSSVSLDRRVSHFWLPTPRITSKTNVEAVTAMDQSEF